ncbi:HAD-IB family hydrolase [Chryseomicrobium sp. FSL W7-1435]|uniref:HAD family hydrolase n=1 Tax=Chryseomicrobium sp. FSL W7-1435 TaxID=2921704 RepID=UPI00315A441D
MKVALFDFDRTIYKHETFTLLMRFLQRHEQYGNRYKKFMRRLMPVYFLYKVKMTPEKTMRKKAMEIYLKTFEGLSELELRAYFQEMAREMADDFNQEVINRLNWHHQQGHRVLVISGAFDVMLDEVLKELPIDEKLGTQVPFENGKLVKVRELSHVHERQKLVRIEESLEGVEVNWEESYAYGDSIYDVDVLDLVGHPVAVQPDVELKRYAKEQGWEIIEE